MRSCSSRCRRHAGSRWCAVHGREAVVPWPAACGSCSSRWRKALPGAGGARCACGSGGAAGPQLGPLVRAVSGSPARPGMKGPRLQQEPRAARAGGRRCPGAERAGPAGGGPGLYQNAQRPLEFCAVHALTRPAGGDASPRRQADEICKRPLEQLALSRVHGFIVNVPSNVSLGFVSLPVRRKHWIAVRQVGGTYYNLDSKLKAPACVGGEGELRAFLQDFLSQGPCEVLLVVSRAVEESGGWLNPE
ncbi:josephin-2 [Chelonoidis abingdonii]|uniref:josephin-2 n=1 Tax=Chelonoidis abingdonii TaxID=106734 RepID=UPI003F490762